MVVVVVVVVREVLNHQEEGEGEEELNYQGEEEAGELLSLSLAQILLLKFLLMQERQHVGVEGEVQEVEEGVGHPPLMKALFHLKVQLVEEVLQQYDLEAQAGLVMLFPAHFVHLIEKVHLMVKEAEVLKRQQEELVPPLQELQLLRPSSFLNSPLSSVNHP